MRVRLKIINSVKHQTFVLLIGLTLGLSLVYFSLSVLSVFIVEDTVIEKLIQNQLAYAQAHYHEHGELPPQQLSFVKIYKAFKNIPPELQQKVATSPRGSEIFTDDKNHYHYRPLILEQHSNHTNIHYYLIAEVSSLLAVSNNSQILSLFILAFILSLMLAIILAYRFSKRIVSPILQLTNTLKSLPKTTSVTKKAQIPWPKLTYEHAYLCETLETTFNKLDESLKREQIFTTDVSHELRTPLTILSNTLCLIQLRGYKDSDLDDLIKINKEMENTVNILLALARQHNLNTQQCELKSSIEQALLKFSSPQLLQKNVNIHIEPHIQIRVNTSLFSLLVLNLINNAFEHSLTSDLTISWQNGELHFSNDTHKLDKNKNDILDSDISQAGVKSEKSTGLGHGLYLVSRIIEVFDWQYHIDQSNNRFSFVLIPIKTSQANPNKTSKYE